jgi:hypothetical protein
MKLKSPFVVWTQRKRVLVSAAACHVCQIKCVTVKLWSAPVHEGIDPERQTLLALVLLPLSLDCPYCAEGEHSEGERRPAHCPRYLTRELCSGLCYRGALDNADGATDRSQPGFWLEGGAETVCLAG